ncbi:hypothetical protein KAI46_14585, partial [bacterium]|nr:hypothetical protein [bacterium]
GLRLRSQEPDALVAFDIDQAPGPLLLSAFAFKCQPGTNKVTTAPKLELFSSILQFFSAIYSSIYDHLQHYPLSANLTGYHLQTIVIIATTCEQWRDT